MNPTATLNSSDNGRGVFFGTSVSIDGDDIVVGSCRSDDKKGAVYVFSKPTTGWVNMTETAKLTASDGDNDDYLGYSVNISGDNIVGGANQDKDELDNVVGSAYVFIKPSSGGWINTTETAKLIASDGADKDQFGVSVSTSGDNIVIGAKNYDGTKTNSGAVYVYNKPLTGGWISSTETTKVTPSVESNNLYFGSSTDIFEDKIIIGTALAYGRDNAYIFELDNIETEIVLTPSDDQYGNIFSNSVAIYGDKIIVGCKNDDVNGSNSGSIYAFNKPESGWVDANEYQKITSTYIQNSNFGDGFGTSVSIDGDYAVVGSNGYTEGSGRANVLHNNNGVWETIATLSTSTTRRAYFGNSVDIDGDVIVVGARLDDGYKGAAYVFTKPTTGWENMTETARLTASDISYQYYLGWDVAVNNNTIVVGANGSKNDDDIKTGGAYVYSMPESGWENMTETAKLTPSDGMDGDKFGESVSCYGNNIVIGALEHNDDTGSAYVYSMPSSGWVNMTETAILTPSDESAGQKFGSSVKIYQDDIVVGSGAGQGSAYVYSKPAEGWSSLTEIAKLTAPTSSNSNFGYSVDMDNDNIIIGAKRDNSNKGAAYIFEKPSSGIWETTTTDSYTITTSDGNNYDWFGTSVSISGNNIIIGAPGDDDKDSGSGSIYIFRYDNSLSDNNSLFINDYLIYPNPTSGIVNIQLEGNNINQLTITDINGRVIISKEVNGNECSADLSNYNKGVYFITLRNEKTTSKIIKQ